MVSPGLGLVTTSMAPDPHANLDELHPTVLPFTTDRVRTSFTGFKAGFGRSVVGERSTAGPCGACFAAPRGARRRRPCGLGVTYVVCVAGAREIQITCDAFENHRAVELSAR